MSKLIRTNISIITYKYNDIMVELVETDETYEVWIYGQDQSYKSYVYGIPVDDRSLSDFRGFLELVEQNIDEYIINYIEAQMPEDTN